MDEALAANFVAPFESAQHLKDWCCTYLNMDFPLGHIDPDSNSSPAEAMYEVYANFRDDRYKDIPGYIWMSSRDSYKTLCESALAIAFMSHFGVPIAHMASIQSQSKKAISYVNSFLRKVEPYLKYHGMKVASESANKAEIIMPNGDTAYVNVIICTISGTNSEHVPFMSFDELDTIRFPTAYAEAKLIPARFKGRGPLTVKCSTRKFAFGIMQKELDNINQSGEKLLRWNIIDITDRCLPERHRPTEPKEVRYIGKDLPLRNLSVQEHESLIVDDQAQYERIEAYAGCAKCPLLAVCKTRLAHRPEHDLNGLYKPIDFTIRQFKVTDPDMAAAQLMCWRPTKAGLVYGRFQDDIKSNDSNVITVEQAWRSFTGEEPPSGVTINDLVQALVRAGIKFKAGVDFGHSHAFAIVVSAILPGNQWWFIDCYARPGLEFEQMIALAEEVRDMYPIDKWYCDQSAPMFIKAFRKRRMPCPKFTKDVPGGVESTRAQIIDGVGNRYLKVIQSERTGFLIDVFKKHAFMLDQAGVPTEEPADDEYADVADSIRYKAQNLFPLSRRKGVGMKKRFTEHSPSAVQAARFKGEDFLALKLKELTGRAQATSGKSQSGSIFWDFSGDTEDQ